MNKILVMENNIFLSSDVYYLNIDKQKVININVEKEKKAKLVIIGEVSYQLNIILEENSLLVVNSLNKNNSVDINLNLKENSKIIYHHSVISDKNSNNIFNINHLANNSCSKIYNNGVNKGCCKLFFTINGIIPKNLMNIECSQNSKIININNGNSKIIPNLIIDSNDINANHSAYIGKIDDEIKFYLASRGISDRMIKKLINKATILGKMELDEESEEFHKLIEEWS